MAMTLRRCRVPSIIVLRRFAEYHDLEGAFARRADIERAKGILMERHSIGEEGAFTMLRDRARRTRRKLADVADAVVTGHPMLPAHRACRSNQQVAPRSSRYNLWLARGNIRDGLPGRPTSTGGWAR
jgi:hypothetical protein